MKNLELELQVAPMSNDTMEYLNVLFGVYSRDEGWGNAGKGTSI